MAAQKTNENDMNEKETAYMSYKQLHNCSGAQEHYKRCKKYMYFMPSKYDAYCMYYTTTFYNKK